MGVASAILSELLKVSVLLQRVESMGNPVSCCLVKATIKSDIRNLLGGSEQHRAEQSATKER